MVLDISLLNTQHYKVRIKGQVEQLKERNNTPRQLGVVAIEKEPSGGPRQPFYFVTEKNKEQKLTSSSVTIL